MIKEALQYLVNLGNTEVRTVGAQQFSSQPLHLVKEPTAAPLVVRNLSGLVDYLINNYDEQPPVLIQVVSPTEVNVYSTFNRDMQRNHLLQAKALLPNIFFEHFLDVESFSIQLQSCFVQNDHRAKLLALVGNIVEDNSIQTQDDGVAQKVVAKTGVATVENVVAPNPVTLKPFRTFIEIAQPECQFVFRLDKGPKAALFEADGGAWKLQAIHSIRDYLNEKLAAQIAEGNVTIIA